jgi:hypothetical protein
MRSLHPLQRRAAATALSVALLGALGACSGNDEPTVAEAGTQLQQAVQRLYASQLGRGEPTVASDAGTDQACGEGRARRVYAATVPTRGFSDRPTAFDYAVEVIDDIGSGWERQSTRSSNDTVTSVGVDGHARLSVTTSQDGRSYPVAGETDCLPTG